MPARLRVETDEDLSPTEPELPGSKPERRKVSRSLLNFWLDAALLGAILFLVWVSLILRMVFPAPTSADGWELWGLSFDQWHELQFGALCVGSLLALEHLVLHWNWVCGVFAAQVLRIRKRPDEGSQALYGVGAFIGILVALMGSVLAALLTVKRPPF